MRAYHSPTSPHQAIVNEGQPGEIVQHIHAEMTVYTLTLNLATLILDIFRVFLGQGMYSEYIGQHVGVI